MHNAAVSTDEKTLALPMQQHVVYLCMSVYMYMLVYLCTCRIAISVLKCAIE